MLGTLFTALLATASLCEVEPPATPDAAVCDAAVHGEGIDTRAFLDAAALRLPALRLRTADAVIDPSCGGRLHAHVEVRPSGDGSWMLSLILSDGRAWYRTLEFDDDQAARGLASVLANLLAAIEDDSVEPDAEDVTMPGGEASAEQPEADPAAPEDPEPPDPEPIPEEPTPTDEAPVLFELGPRLGLAGSLGLAPGAGWQGLGADLALDMRLPDGLSFGLGLRTLSRGQSGASLVRTRVSLGLGVTSRWGRFELSTLFSALLEPWWIREGGSRVPLGAPPLIGGFARLTPGLLVPVGAATMRIAADLGLAIVVEAAPGALTAAVALEPGTDPILRAGGVELDLGLVIGVWIPVKARSRPAGRNREKKLEAP